jgi:hypothetical protein
MKKYKLKGDFEAEHLPAIDNFPEYDYYKITTKSGAEFEMHHDDFFELFEEIVEEPHMPHDWAAENPM